MIEEGFHKNEISQQIIGEYLNHPGLQDIDALILGCTHYPLIKKQVAAFYDQSVEVIDASDIVAQALHDLLSENNLLSLKPSAEDHFLVSDFTKSFEAAAQLFFRKKIRLEKHELWE